MKKRDRRSFVKKTLLAGVGVWMTGRTVAGFTVPADNPEFLFPVTGDVLHGLDGKMERGKLTITARVKAAPGRKIKINGKMAGFKDGVYEAPVYIDQYEHKIRAEDVTSGNYAEVTVCFLKNFSNKYRLSFDDCIWFLQDIYEKQYRSIFDTPLLNFLKLLHDKYGTCLHLNLFYATTPYFNLSMFPDTYRDEWKANAHWLKLSFHARQEFPDAPYQNADYDTVYNDCKKVVQEILRFAGKESLAEVTTLHWGASNIWGARALRNNGFRGLVGYYNVDDDLPPVSYYLSADQIRHLKKRYIWKDVSEDITFVRCSIVVNLVKPEEITGHLNKAANDVGRLPFVELLTHEQYFYPEYYQYLPDYQQRLEASVKWAHDNGYTPSLLGHISLK